jgi:hypothetical protein
MLKFGHFEFDEVKIATNGCSGRRCWSPKANTWYHNTEQTVSAYCGLEAGKWKDIIK